MAVTLDRAVIELADVMLNSTVWVCPGRIVAFALVQETPCTTVEDEQAAPMAIGYSPLLRKVTFTDNPELVARTEIAGWEVLRLTKGETS